ncbi:ABC transporter ATP-binding protein [Actinomadura decatromicini]|uniref:ABC transporter ATP-binding protein n=1 Tax=Actinomadura decatromicini TaxID=2604572 RepID=A0A5D3F8X3_9ACTN|nr:ABC transporter ATP-binding protein [Actinomadura decatromicini]TYK44344.1 ABC transporter ATP-binding protein [Actinomadura decatromicini]
MTPLLEVAGLRVTARPDRLLVDGVDLTVGPGESVALVGESGSGKSLTAKALVGLLPPGLTASGEVRFDGAALPAKPDRRSRALRGSGIGLLLQDPFTMLNPVSRVRKHLDETRRAHGHGRLTRTETAERLREVGITDPHVADRYPFELSGGLRQRVALAASLAADPRLLVADEPTTALDATTQHDVLALIRRTQRTRGMGLLLITHDLRVAFSLCDRVLVMYAGSIVESGPPGAVRAAAAHPYSAALLAAEPPLDQRRSVLSTIPGRVPQAGAVAGRCAFADRCAWQRAECAASRPRLIELADGHGAACHRTLEIREELVPAHADSGPRLGAAPVGEKEDVLRVSGLDKAFRGPERTKVPALRGVELRIGAGETVAVVGESGSGKTTLARCVLGLVKPDAGRIDVAGTTLFPPRAGGGPAHRLVQCVFQDPYASLNPRHTVGYSLTEALRQGESGDGVADLLVRVGLPAGYAGKRPADLSGGERQRVAIARAVAVRPRLLVCDEPVAALDVSVQAQILEVFRELQADGQSMLFITHDLAVVRQVADRVLVLYRGEVVESGDCGPVLDRPDHPYTRRLVDAVPTGTADWLGV